MINGRIYDSLSMNEIGSRERVRGKLWFETGKGMVYTFPTGISETWTYTIPNCE